MAGDLEYPGEAIPARLAPSPPALFLQKGSPVTTTIDRPEEFMALATAFQKSRAILSAVELSLFTALGDGEKLPDELALLTGTRERTIDRLGNALVALGLLEKRADGAFANTPFGRTHLVKGRPGYLAGIHHTAGMWTSWSHLTLSVTRGGAAHIEPMNERGKRWLAPFIAAMDARARVTAPELFDRIDATESVRLLDVGGGSGAHALEFVRRGADKAATVFDLPNVVELTREHLAKDPAGSRVGTAEGDFRHDPLGEGYDLALLSNIVHMLSPRDAARLIDHAAAALAPGGRIAIVDFLVDETRTAPLPAALFALNMIVATEGGDVYTEGEIAGWMRDGGFREIRREELSGGSSLLVARFAGVPRAARAEEKNPAIAR